MTPRRSLLALLALCLISFTFAAHQALAQGKKAATDETILYCPNCGKKIAGPDETPPSTCPHCSAKLTVTQNPDGSYKVRYDEKVANKFQKPLLYGGGGLLVVGLIALLLKHTVFAAAKPKKKKKRRDEDDEDEEEDRPRKRKRPVVEDEEEERPRKVKKKPRIVDEDEG
jgi:DNA-directed RNA polymerase subunit RPC12/RpoP